jgi:hypothetical protein
MDIIEFSLKRIIINWWPLIIAFGGLTLLLVAVATNNSVNGNNGNKGGTE